MRGARRLIKHLLAETLYRSGALYLYRRWRFRDAGVVLTYHRVMPVEIRGRSASAAGICVTPETFERHLALVKRWFAPLALGEFDRWLAGDRNDRFPCLITFDDGWADNAEHAAPALEAAGVSACIFLPIDYIGTDRLFWQERLGRRLDEAVPAASGNPAIASYLAERGLSELARLEGEARRAAIAEHVRSLKARPGAWREELSELASLLGTPESPGPDRYMDWPTVRALPRRGIAIGSHGCSHTPMPFLDDDDLERELQDSRGRLESECGTPVTSIAYPNGDFDDRVASAAKRAGYALGFTTQSGWNRRGDSPLTLKRINIHEDATATPALFLCRLLGLF